MMHGLANFKNGQWYITGCLSTWGIMPIGTLNLFFSK